MKSSKEMYTHVERWLNSGKTQVEFAKVHIPASSDSHSSFSRIPVPVFLGQFETIKL